MITWHIKTYITENLLEQESTILEYYIPLGKLNQLEENNNSGKLEKNCFPLPLDKN